MDFTFQVPPDDRNMMYENQILGLPRIRMLKVHDSSCAVEYGNTGCGGTKLERFLPKNQHKYLKEIIGF